MKLATLAVPLAVCSGQWLSRSFRVLPLGSGRLATKKFTSQLEAVMQRNWYVADDPRLTVSDVYQISHGPTDWNTANLFVTKGWGLTRGRMTQYKFSFIGETKNCTIGFTHPHYFVEGARASGPGLELWKGSLSAKGGTVRYDYAFDVGKDSDDVDWFIEYHQDGHVEVYMTLNGQPLDMAFLMPRSVIVSEKFAANIRPLLRCNVHDPIDSEKGIVVVQYSPVIIPWVRPYVGQRKPDGRNFEMRNLGDKFPEGFGGEKFYEEEKLRLVIEDEKISLIGRNSVTCRVDFQRDGVLGPKLKHCSISNIGSYEPYESLDEYLFQFLPHSDRYELLPSGDFALYSKKFEKMVFTPDVNFDTFVGSPF